MPGKPAPKLPLPTSAPPKAPAKPNLFNNDDEEDEEVSVFKMPAKAAPKLAMPALPKPSAKANLFNNDDDDEDEGFLPKKKADLKPLAMPNLGAKTLPPVPQPQAPPSLPVVQKPPKVLPPPPMAPPVQ